MQVAWFIVLPSRAELAEIDRKTKAIAASIEYKLQSKRLFFLAIADFNW